MDSRRFLGKVVCDGGKPQLFRSLSSTTVGIVTNVTSFVDYPANMTPKRLCNYLRSHPAEFDAGELLQIFLKQRVSAPSDQDLNTFCRENVSAVEHYLATNPNSVQDIEEGFSYQAIIIDYNGASKVIQTRGFDIILVARAKTPFCNPHTPKVWLQSDHGDFLATGEGDAFGRRLGNKFIQRCKPTISETTPEYARDLAIDVLRETIQLEPDEPGEINSVGGPIDVLFIDGKSPVKIKRVAGRSRGL